MGRDNAAVAKELRVSVRSVQRWRRDWEDRGTQGLRSRGPVSRPKLNDALFAVLEKDLDRGPAAHGRPDPVAGNSGNCTEFVVNFMRPGG
ncbi:helix-turn-helix domain-containing protein [Streptomyces sp. NPDC090445]|uniref:helix-turn-helix domain-containing protein n=1 Tax=Streptomyces sp. NPDC090445 TaxID=3365963 RepID=UPI00381467C2